MTGVVSARMLALAGASAAVMAWSLVAAAPSNGFVTASSVITTICGTGQAGFSGDGGQAVNARLNQPRDSAIGPDGSIYIADTYNNRIRRIAPNGTITTIAGNGSASYNGDNRLATTASLSWPHDVAVDNAGVGTRQQVETDRGRMLTEKSTLRQMVDHLEDAVIFFNHEHRVLSFSRSAESILGAPLEEAVGRAVGDLLPAVHPLHTLLAGPFDRGTTRARTLSLVGDDGEARDYLVSVWPVRDGGRLIGAMVLLRNLQSIRGVQSLISYSAKLAALGGLTSGVTHEVKNPLNAMMIHLEIVRSRLGPRSDEVGRSLEVIGGEIRRLDRVVQGFLEFARPQELKLTAVHLNALLSSITSLLDEEWRPAGLHADLMLSPGLPAITGDEESLRQAFFNIIQNAGQAMPGGGTATIRTVLDESGIVSVRIADEGVGIPAADLDKVFKLYYTTRPDGNGIGLALVYRIVQMHDGSIALTSEVGRGTTVTVSLPAT